jgi:hypothetical protein
MRQFCVRRFCAKQEVLCVVFVGGTMGKHDQRVPPSSSSQSKSTIAGKYFNS